MPTSKKIIAEQVLYRLYGGFHDNSSPVQEYDIYKATEQKINIKFKTEHYAVTMQAGETIPEGCMIATYEDIDVEPFGDKSKITLPAIPINLPRNQGIHEISYNGQPFIPLQSGQEFLLQTDKLLNDLMGYVGYTPQGKTIYFTKDIFVMGIDKVTVKLVTFDISAYSIYDYLPIPSDYEEIIVNELVAQFAPVMPENGLNNNFTTANQKSQ